MMRYVVLAMGIILYMLLLVHTVRDVKKTTANPDLESSGWSVFCVGIHFVALIIGFVWLCFNYW